MNRLRVGFIGAGRISDLHALGYRDHPRATLTAVCDVDREVAAARAVRWGVPEAAVGTDYRELLAREDVDLVEILLPHDLHYPVTMEALAAGKHVSLQKPMGLTLDEADRMVAAAHAADRRLRVFENALFYPPVVRAKSLVDAGAIGEPLSIRIKANKGDPRSAWIVPPTTRAWRQDPQRCGGGPMTFDDGHHKFAVAWHFMGKARKVHAWIGRTEIEPGVFLDVPAQISWQFSGGRYGNLEVVYSPDLPVETEQYAQHDPVEITGTRGVLWITRGHGRLLAQPPLLLFSEGRLHAFDDVEESWESSFVAATRHLVDVLLDGGSPRLSGEEGREVLRFCLAAQQSAREGRDVVLD